MSRYILIDYWNGNSEPFGTIQEAVKEAKKRIARIRMTRDEYECLKIEGDNLLYIVEHENRKENGKIVASVEITVEGMGRFY